VEVAAGGQQQLQDDKGAGDQRGVESHTRL
jgi:hypothetical protein